MKSLQPIKELIENVQTRLDSLENLTGKLVDDLNSNCSESEAFLQDIAELKRVQSKLEGEEKTLLNDSAAESYNEVEKKVLLAGHFDASFFAAFKRLESLKATTQEELRQNFDTTLLQRYEVYSLMTASLN